MLEVVPYQLDDIKNQLKRNAIDILGITDAEYEGSNVSQLINLLAYANVINNTNFTFGLNEAFITQAQDRTNVIKHARQLGYTHSRKKSFQYKIKVKATKSGYFTLEKYSEFGNSDNSYIYMGESITDIYGTYVYMKPLSNEYNNTIPSLFSEPSTNRTNYIISEEGQVCYIHEKDEGVYSRMLLESIDNKEIPVLSSLPQEVYVWKWDGAAFETLSGYRSFERVGTVDTFLYDPINELFKVQITIDSTNGEFPIYTVIEENLYLVENAGVLTFGDNSGNVQNLTHPLKYFNKVTVDPAGANIELSLNDFVYNSGDYNATLALNVVPVIENFNPSTDVTNDANWNGTITTSHNIISGSVDLAKIVFSDGRTREVQSSELIEGANTVIISNQTTVTNDSDIVVSDSSIQLSHINIKNVELVLVNEGNEKFVIDNFSWDASTGIVTILDANNDPDTQYDTKTVDVDYEYFEDLSTATSIDLSYSYTDDSLAGSPVTINYSYDIGADGTLDKRFFFSDLRGEYIENESPYEATTNPLGWSGFYATEFNTETSVLTFDVSGNNNQYVKMNNNGIWEEALQLQEVMKTPFRKTRFSTTTRHEDAQGNVTFDPFDKSLTFASSISNEVKDELEIIVKEGTLKRYNDLDSQGTALYPELTVEATESIVSANHFIIEGIDIENNGIEMYVTRVLEDGTVEIDEQWQEREYLLAENTGVYDKSFITLPDLNYENYINVYTKYAGTGIPMALDFTMKLNVLTSKGAQGGTNQIIKPLNNEDFASAYYFPETLTPHILYIEGSDEESTDNIRENAPLFNNTANRAVTKNDYLAITEAQGFVSKAEIWGGEENTPLVNPGHVYISLIPFSRPTVFKNQNNASYFFLDSLENTDLFFPTYYQITGSEQYNIQQSETARQDKSVLFNILDSFKVITIQLNYVKTVYMDYSLDIKVLNYKFGQTVSETNNDIFNAVQSFFASKIETYNSVYYNSTLIKHIDNIIGDGYGLELDTRLSVDLYDNISAPEKGTFSNFQKENLTKDYLDKWAFEMPLNNPIEELFKEDYIIGTNVIEYGGLVVSNLTNCNTDDFITEFDRLYMQLEDGTFVSVNDDGVTEIVNPNSASNVITISIMYTRNRTIVDPAVGDYAEHFKVGEYTIYKQQGVIMLRLFTHSIFNIDNVEKRYTVDSNGDLIEDPTNGYVNDFGEWVRFESDGVTGSQTGTYVYDENGTLQSNIAAWGPRKIIDIQVNADPADISFNSLVKDSYKINPYYTVSTPIGYSNVAKFNADPADTSIISRREVPLPRKPFTENIIKMQINAKNDNIKSRRNVFGRLREVNFI